VSALAGVRVLDLTRLLPDEARRLAGALLDLADRLDPPPLP